MRSRRIRRGVDRPQPRRRLRGIENGRQVGPDRKGAGRAAQLLAHHRLAAPDPDFPRRRERRNTLLHHGAGRRSRHRGALHPGDAVESSEAEKTVHHRRNDGARAETSRRAGGPATGPGWSTGTSSRRISFTSTASRSSPTSAWCVRRCRSRASAAPRDSSRPERLESGARGRNRGRRPLRRRQGALLLPDRKRGGGVPFVPGLAAG